MERLTPQHASNEKLLQLNKNGNAITDVKKAKFVFVGSVRQNVRKRQRNKTVPP